MTHLLDEGRGVGVPGCEGLHGWSEHFQAGQRHLLDDHFAVEGAGTLDGVGLDAAHVLGG